MELRKVYAALSLALLGGAAFGELYETKPLDPYFDQFQPVKAPVPLRLWLKTNDKLAFVGDSITEQRMWTTMVEAYLTMCAPQYKVDCRNFGQFGEKTSDFLARADKEVLSFKPTIALSAYGMNDRGYGSYQPNSGTSFLSNTEQLVEKFLNSKARVVLGSPSCVGDSQRFQDMNQSVDALNVILCNFRNLDIQAASRYKIGFADTFWPMLLAGYKAQLQYGSDFKIAGTDGTHPDWAGHTVIAYGFLRGLGFKSPVAGLVVNDTRGTATVSVGNKLVSFKDGELTVKSERYPFCVPDGLTSDSKSMAAGMNLVPFMDDLSRFSLTIIGAKASRYQVTWGGTAKIFTRLQMQKGINLASEFPSNPFRTAFMNVFNRIDEKQSYEKRQMQVDLRQASAQSYAGVLATTEQTRKNIIAGITAARVPITHTIKITRL